jgi:hypothetical protein
MVNDREIFVATILHRRIGLWYTLMCNVVGNLCDSITSYRVGLLSGAFTTNVVAAAPVLYCKHVLTLSKTVSLLCPLSHLTKTERNFFSMESPKVEQSFVKLFTVLKCVLS